MRACKLLWKAPYDFDPEVVHNMKLKFDMNFTGQPEVVVCDPGAPFVWDDNVLSLFPEMKILATPSTGSNHIDMDACDRRHIKVLSLLDDRIGLEEISASAEFTFKLLLDALRMEPARELQNRTVGIIGYGRIGRRIERWCKAFGAWTCRNDPLLTQSTPLDGMFAVSDAVVVCCTSNKNTYRLVTRELIEGMKEGAALVNTSRGEVIDEDGLVEVMKKRKDLRVAVDVLVGQANGTAQPDRLKELGAIVTPHIAGATFDSRTKAAKIILGLIERECYERRVI